MSKTEPVEQVKFLVSCIGHTANGRPDFAAVAQELGIVTKAAAQKRYERMLKANGVTSKPQARAASKISNADNDDVGEKPVKPKATRTSKRKPLPDRPTPAKRVKKQPKSEDSVKSEDEDEDAQQEHTPSEDGQSEDAKPVVAPKGRKQTTKVVKKEDNDSEGSPVSDPPTEAEDSA
ncbi:hypothetical protein S7711_06595 [Stachybotrys chartarum IBT 7711]|uniref:Myb-like DNA-binding domain-containing protein n=1 Tax=Stachybotrys chartarum (strain CBS 109288 / IBT 7711) TaxID=1280523 RepID=A0A084AYP9_STACB|nr:hypothetical protein S7711_06595 [Stachybotrys chartarum IBT 7711]KFA78308.1 hypothetical protein S40288_05031 [Stachybotrys chartarum IBT 40288]